MPTYRYRCLKCNREFDVQHSIDMLDKIKIHSDVTEGHEGLEIPCDGIIKRIIQTIPVIFKGRGWTPKHFGGK
jgi:predicted nucleic acid-binding Zn ribbon protein